MLSAAAAHDSFTAALLRVLRETRPARAALADAGVPEISLGLHRSDYMLDAPSGRFLQVLHSFGCSYGIVKYHLGAVAGVAHTVMATKVRCRRAFDAGTCV